MPSPHGVITVGTSFQRAYECDVECYELATATVASKELTVIREAVIKDAPTSNRLARAFEHTEGTKEVPIDPSDSDGKMLCVGADLSPQIGKRAH
jgi:U3 small nucleolar ribonucleoprotein component